MSRKAFITIDGLYDWDNTLFEQLQLPTQFNDASIITDELILETMDLEVLYPDPTTFKKALGIFSRSRLHKWQKITDALYHVYNPFINFTRDETRTITETRELEANRTDNLQSQRTDNLTSLETRNLAESANNTKQVAAWDNQTSSLTDREKDITSSTDTGTDQIANTGTQITANTGTQKTTDEGTVVTEDIFHSEGDSAMYTPTDVAKKEFELRAMDDAISYIVNDIKNRFCLTVY